MYKHLAKHLIPPLISSPEFLVVGADCLVGRNLLEALERRGHDALGTTRRKETLTSQRVYLDLQEHSNFHLPDGIGYVFVVAAVSKYDQCEQDPISKDINTNHIPSFVASLLEQGVFVTFISTNAVFGGEIPSPHEDASPDAKIPYAAQKQEAETLIRSMARRLGAESNFNIVRLTKVLSLGTSPLPQWLDAWKVQQPVEPFGDLIFAPVSARYIGESLATIGAKRVPGNLHLSGAADINYVDFANALAEKLGLDSRLVHPSSASAKQFKIPFKPRFSGLGMKRTTRLTGIQPQSLTGVASQLVMEIGRTEYWPGLKST